MKSYGKLIVLEGHDNVGKSTIAKSLVDRLTNCGLSAECLSLPGNEEGTLGNHVYKLHHDIKLFNIDALNPTSLQLLHAAAHIDAIENQIRPRLKKGCWVILDRFWWSTMVYGRVLGADKKSLDIMRQLAEYHWRDISPAKTILITRSIKTGDKETRRLANHYKNLAKEQCIHTDVTQIKNVGTIDTVVDNVWLEIEALLPKSKRKPKNHTKEASGKVHKDHSKSPMVWEKLSPLKPSVVYDTYWQFACKRQAILFQRISGKPKPWSDDPILQRHRFTNAYRAADRVSQYLIRHVIYNDNWSPEDTLFRIILFKIFNKIETWQLLENHFGSITWHDFDQVKYMRVLHQARQKGHAIYSGAYIMASATAYGNKFKHENHLAMLQQMMSDELANKIQSASSLQEVYLLLRNYPSIGPFLAFQYCIDLNYSKLINFDEMDFVVPGPGARDGIAKCFIDRGGLSEADIIHLVTERQKMEFDRLGLKFQQLGNRPLQLIDCQNLFCEVDKYARVHHPDVSGITDRKRIKQVFSPRPEAVTLWFPPKWGINKYFKSKRSFPETQHNAHLFY